MSVFAQSDSRLYQWYLLFVAGTGLVLIGAGIAQIIGEPFQLNFWTLLLLATLSSIVTATDTVAERVGISYGVQSAVAIAAVPLYGPLSATLINGVATFAMWLFKPRDELTWKKSGQQLAFNLGMSSLAMFGSGLLFVSTEALLQVAPILAETVSWLIAGTAYGQINIWLLFGIIRLQHGRAIQLVPFWLEHRWALLLDAAVMSIGGALLAVAVRQFDLLGILIFFLPVLLSIFSFRLYVGRMQEHMDNLEEIVAERTQALRFLNEEKNAFLAVLTHDMKTPLTSIGLYAELIQKRPALIQERPQMADTIVRNQRALLDMVNNIIDLERMEAMGGLPVDVERFDLTPFILNLVESLRPQIVEKDQELSTAFPEHLVVETDKSHFARILLNLLSNAVKYTPEKGSINLEIEKDGENIICRVRDNGYGIPASELPYIFEPYRRVTKHEKLARGTGLGLTIARALVQTQGGTVAVTSEEDQGSEFTVTLPIIVA